MADRRVAPGRMSEKSRRGPLVIGLLAALVLTMAPLAVSAAPGLEAELQRALATRYGSLIGARGLSVTHEDGQAYRIWLSLKPPTSRAAGGGTWTEKEGEKILASVSQEIQQRFPGLVLHPASGLEATDVTGSVVWSRTLAGGGPPRAGTSGALAGAAPVVSAAAGEQLAQAAYGHALDLNEVDAQLRPSKRGIREERKPAVELIPVEPTLVEPSPVVPDVESDLATDTIFADKSLLYPRDREVMEWQIEKDLLAALNTTTLEPQVRASLERPRVVRLFIQFVYRGRHLENAPQVLSVVRDTVQFTLNDRYRGLRVHKGSRIRVREFNEHFVWDYHFLDLTPFGKEDPNQIHPFFHQLRLPRDRVVELPTAFPLPTDVAGIRASVVQRNLGDDELGLIEADHSLATALRLRQSFFSRFEMAASLTSLDREFEPAAGALFAETSASPMIGTIEAKYQLPYEVGPFKLAVGYTQSFQSAGDRVFLLPEDFQDFYNLYLAGGWIVDPSLVIHWAARLSTATLKPFFPDRQIVDGGIGFEYRVMDRGLFMMEVTGRQVGGTGFSQFGALADASVFDVNAGMVVGTSLGDAEILVKRLLDEEFKEIELALSYRW